MPKGIGAPKAGKHIQNFPLTLTARQSYLMLSAQAKIMSRNHIKVPKLVLAKRAVAYVSKTQSRWIRLVYCQFSPFRHFPEDAITLLLHAEATLNQRETPSVTDAFQKPITYNLPAWDGCHCTFLGELCAVEERCSIQSPGTK